MSHMLNLFVNLMIHFLWLLFYSVHTSKDWVQSGIPQIVKNGVEVLEDDVNDIDDMDAETFVQAYVNVVAGACISLGNKMLLDGLCCGICDGLYQCYNSWSQRKLKLASGCYNVNDMAVNVAIRGILSLLL